MTPQTAAAQQLAGPAHDRQRDRGRDGGEHERRWQQPAWVYPVGEPAASPSAKAIAANEMPMTALLVCSVTPRYGPTSRSPTTSSTRTAPAATNTAVAANRPGRRRRATTGETAGRLPSGGDGVDP